MMSRSDSLASTSDQDLPLPPSRSRRLSSLHSSPSSISNLLLRPESTSRTERYRRWNHSRMLNDTLDRVNVLGDDNNGHTGCVNALSWAEDGNLLISGGDDTTIRLWIMDTSDIEQDYPFTCTSVVHTGHRANIFNAKMLPHSSRIVTAAGDMQIRVFDVKTALGSALTDNAETQYSCQQLCTNIIRCHRDSVKKIITEDSPDMFLSVSEDGTVRQHDLRTPHNCRGRACSAPLVEVGHELFTLSLSALAPHQFVVAGEAPHGYLFDRRHLRRTIENNWGQVPKPGEGPTTCVRKFGRPPTSTRQSNAWRITRDHITGSRMSQSNSHEVILSYSGDGVYLYSTNDDIAAKDVFSPSSEVLPSTVTDERGESENSPASSSSSFEFPLGLESEEYLPDVPLVLPRSRYVGARNVATIKDVNFLGPNDEWIVSGSDDGNFFIWDKKNARLHGIYEGDGSVVNVIEGHPHFPLLAVSGIDTTVKLFAPKVSGTPQFSRIANASNIVKRNERPGSTSMASGDNLVMLRMLALASVNTALDDGEVAPLQCTSQ